VSVSSVGISKDAVQVVVSQPRFSVGTAGFIGFSFAEITVGSATVQATGASQQVNGSRIERTAAFHLPEGPDPSQQARLELDAWTFHPEDLDLRVPASQCRE
jgi:hypothetical protein